MEEVKKMGLNHALNISFRVIVTPEDNGDLYMKEFMTFCHIVKNTKKTIEKFMSQREFELENPNQINCIVNPKNMYKCKGTNDWLYTEAGCTYGVG